MRSLHQLAWRNLKRNRKSSILSILAVALGVSMIVAAKVLVAAIQDVNYATSTGQFSVNAFYGDMSDFLLTAVGVAILLASGFIIFNAFAMSIAQRRREIGVLRSLGMTRSQVMRLVFIEALALGGGGTLLGLLAGPFIGRGEIALLDAIGEVLDVTLGVFSTPHTPPGAYLLAGALGIGITLIATIVPAWQAVRVSPLVALQQPTISTGITRTRRGVFGAIIAVFLFIYLMAAPPGRWVSAPIDGILTVAFLGLWIISLALVFPAVRSVTSQLVKWLLNRTRLSNHASWRLAADNLLRNPQRVALTVFALAISVMSITAITGTIAFVFDVLIGQSFVSSFGQSGYAISPVSFEDPIAAVGSIDIDTIQLPPELIQDIRLTIEGRAAIAEGYLGIIPDLSLISGYPSYFFAPEELRDIQFFTFTEGDWDTALPILESGCGVLVAPGVATRFNASVGETISIPGVDSEVVCTIAGVGANSMFGMSIVSLAALESFDAIKEPIALFIMPNPGTDIDRLEGDLETTVGGFENVYFFSYAEFGSQFSAAPDMARTISNAMLGLAILAAALGVVNTSVISITERRHELGMLRSVGATRRQVVLVVIGEAALMGVVGGLLGLIGGIGVIAILVLTYGGNSWGVSDLPLLQAAWDSIQPALLNTIWAVIVAPFLSAGAAYIPVRTTLRGSAIDMLESGRVPEIPPHMRDRRQMLRSYDFLAWRNLNENRPRSILNILAVSIGVATTIAGSMTAQSIINSLSDSQDVQSIIRGLLDYLDLMMSIIGVIITLAAGFIIFNAFMMSVTQRQRQIGALRSLGMTRRQVMRVILIEALLIASIGTGIGVIGGPLLGLGIIRVFRLFLGGILVFTPSLPSALTVVMAVGLGLCITILSVVIPAWSAARISPLVAMRMDADGEKRGVRSSLLPWIGLAILIGMAVYLLLAPPGKWVQAPTDTLLSLVFVMAWLAALVLILPALIIAAGRALRKPLTRHFGSVGQLMADNLQRSRSRVALTIASLALGLALVTGMSGFIGFFVNEFFGPQIEASMNANAWQVAGFEISSGMSGYASMDSLMLPPGLKEDIRSLAEGQATVVDWHFVIVPELSFFGDTYFSFVVDAHDVQAAGDWIFSFTEGDWETALPIMDAGCGLLASPVIVSRNNVELYDSLTVTGPEGPVECTVAGIGFPYVEATIISLTAVDQFGLEEPLSLLILPEAGANRADLKADFLTLFESYPGVSMIELNELGELQEQVFLAIPQMFNAMLVLAIIAAALGVINTTLMSVTERQREFGLLRAVGATRRQVTQVIVGEAALMGIIGGLLGLAAGLGMIAVFITVYGGNSWGHPDLDLWASAGRAIRTALPTGLLALLCAPFVTAVSSYFPARSILRGAAIETLDPTRKPPVSRQELRQGPVRNRRLSGLMSQSPISSLALRNIEQERTRTILSMLAVTLGVTLMIVSDVVGRSLLAGMTQTEDLAAITKGLTDQLLVWIQLTGIAVLLVAGFIIFNAFMMSVTQRRQQIGALRSLGMTRRQIMRLIVVEALIVGISGTLLGLISGPLIGQGILALIEALNFDLFPFISTTASTSTILLAVGLGIGVSLGSVYFPARSSTRISPLEALREQRPDTVGNKPVTGTTILGLAIASGTTLFLVLAPPGEWAKVPINIIFTALCSLLWLVSAGLCLPALVGLTARLSRHTLARVMPANGRLAADNLGRDRSRVTLTIIALGLGVALVIAMTGFFHFFYDEFFAGFIEDRADLRKYEITAFDLAGDVGTYADQESLTLDQEVMDAVYAIAEDRAVIVENTFVIIPELSILGDSFFSMMVPAQQMVAQSLVIGNPLFTFSEGSWEEALPIMIDGCGVIIAPVIAERNNVALYDTFTVSTEHGSTDCVVAGLGQTSFGGASIISDTAAAELGIDTPMDLSVFPLPGEDADALQQELQALVDRYQYAYLTTSSSQADTINKFNSTTVVLMNSMLLVAVIAGALGMINTTVMSITERQHELGLLRAIGATKKQTRQIVMGESALMGLVAGAVGLFVGTGLVAIFATTFGGTMFGVELNVWAAAGRNILKTLPVGAFGVIAAPLVAAAASWLPSRVVLRGTPIETMEPRRTYKEFSRRAIRGLFSRGSLQTRFALGTALLMIIVLGSLTATVTSHARIRLEETFQDSLRQLAGFSASALGLALEEDVANLTLDTLVSNEVFDFDSDAMLQMGSLVDDMTANGLIDFTIADRDNIILLSMDRRNIGQLASELDLSAETVISSESARDDWSLQAYAPVRNSLGDIVGSVRLKVDMAELSDFLTTLRNRLWLVGGVLALAGVFLAWRMAAPLSRTAQRLADHAGGVVYGEYRLFDVPDSRGVSRWLSLRARLTLTMAGILVVVVIGLQVAAIPIERQQVQGTMLDGLVAIAEWVGNVASDTFAETGEGEFAFDDGPILEQLLDGTEMLDLRQLQQMNEQMENDDLLYTALVNTEGEIVLSDQFALIGAPAPVYTNTRVEDDTWNGDEVWVVSTPLRQGREGEQIGAMRMAVSKDPLAAFLDEARNLFRLAGLVAVLAGVLLAQALGRAVSVPVERLEAGTRRVAAGDLSVHFEVNTGDELGRLAQAYNQMVIGLQEREWLRDMFGRFVSQEVAEAIRQGQVRLEGENRVVSVLFCDIRDFTALSEKHSPEEVVALLNKYLPVVVKAAQAYGGTVNKFGGDSTLVIYGAPHALQESAYQAVNTALDMHRNLQLLNEELMRDGYDPIRIGVGINTGEVLAGAVGPAERQEYTVIGDTVNLASRIEALNKQYPDYNVFISHHTYQALGQRRQLFTMTDLGEIAIRGKTTNVRVWAVGGK